MMNIFIMMLITVFMAGYYIINSPSSTVIEHETEYAINKSDLRSIAECAAAQHNAQIKGTVFQDICLTQNEITSDFICLSPNGFKTSCEIVRNQKPAASYIITKTKPLPDSQFNNIMEILEEGYANAGNFGIFNDAKIISAGTSNQRSVPKVIIDELNLENGQLVYLTQYEIPDAAETFTAAVQTDVICPTGTVKTYRFGRWQCVGYNMQTDCGGDMVWDSDLQECVEDDSRKPLCGSEQTAVLIDSVWECINPFPATGCPDNMISRLNYTTLQWECISDPSITTPSDKCKSRGKRAVYGASGATLRVPRHNSCTDCEKMIVDPDTCESVCVPDANKMNNPNCYPGDIDECTGASRGVYFGFPSYSYIATIENFDGADIVLDATHSQNRKFNCLDCGDGYIDDTTSNAPYVANCQ